MSEVLKSLPLYRSHKTVRAARISWVGPVNMDSELVPVFLEGGGKFEVDCTWARKNTPKTGDYLVQDSKGSVHCSKAEFFESDFNMASGTPEADAEPESTAGLTFGKAIEALKKGHRIAREGWNGRGMYLWLLPAAMVKAEWCREPHLKSMAEANGGEIECLGSIRMMTSDKKVLTGWLASQTDVLSEDWYILL